MGGEWERRRVSKSPRSCQRQALSAASPSWAEPLYYVSAFRYNSTLAHAPSHEREGIVMTHLGQKFAVHGRVGVTKLGEHGGV